MPASGRARSRATSSRPYDRRSPTTSPAQSRNSQPTKPVQAPSADADMDADMSVPPDHPGLPTYAEYKCIESGYLHSLSPRKRDKALITQAMFDKIWDVLHQPEACTVETPQFRFWVRKMFTLSRPVHGDTGWSWGGAGGGGGGTGVKGAETQRLPDADSDAEEAALELERAMMLRRSSAAALSELTLTAVVLHENRPVAIMEQLYELFCYCHVRAGHGGRDKTCAVIREHYSWVPKELTAQFVKACPTCTLKRSGQALALGKVGMDVGVLAHRRVAGRGGKSGVPSEVGVEEMTVPVEPLKHVWPTTGGPLDPANPEPCGVRERKRERERLRACGGDMEIVGLSTRRPVHVSPALGSGTQSGARESCSLDEWSSVPRALTLDVSPLHPCHPLNNNTTRRNGGQGQETRTLPTKTGLPTPASALSNESLDGRVHPTTLGPPRDAVECLLPPALRPLRLLGPLHWQPESEPDPRRSHPLQIDPLLLSFNYPGLGLSSSSSSSSSSSGRFEPGCVSADCAGPDAMARTPPGLPGTAPEVDLDLPSHALHRRRRRRLRTPSHMDVPALDRAGDLPMPMVDAPDERGARATLPLSLSTEATAQRPCGSRYHGHGHGHRDGPLAMLYHSGCSAADEVGPQLELTSPLSFSITTV